MESSDEEFDRASAPDDESETQEEALLITAPSRARRALITGGLVAIGVVLGAAVGVGGTLAATAPGPEDGPELVHIPPGGPYDAGTVIYYGTVEGNDVWTGTSSETGDRCLILDFGTGSGSVNCGSMYSTPKLSASTDAGDTITVKFPTDGSPGILTHSQ